MSRLPGELHQRDGRGEPAGERDGRGRNRRDGKEGYERRKERKGREEWKEGSIRGTKRKMGKGKRKEGWAERGMERKDERKMERDK